MANPIYRFTSQVTDRMVSNETYPVVDEYGTLLGGFTVLSGENVAGFISGTGSPVTLRVSANESFYFTPKLNQNLWVTHAVVSELPLSRFSRKVTAAEKEEIHEKEPNQ